MPTFMTTLFLFRACSGPPELREFCSWYDDGMLPYLSPLPDSPELGREICCGAKAVGGVGYRALGSTFSL
jgi:hypothetical protein